MYNMYMYIYIYVCVLACVCILFIYMIWYIYINLTLYTMICNQIMTTCKWDKQRAAQVIDWIAGWGFNAGTIMMQMISCFEMGAEIAGPWISPALEPVVVGQDSADLCSIHSINIPHTWFHIVFFFSNIPISSHFYPFLGAQKCWGCTRDPSYPQPMSHLRQFPCLSG